MKIDKLGAGSGLTALLEWSQTPTLSTQSSYSTLPELPAHAHKFVIFFFSPQKNASHELKRAKQKPPFGHDSSF